MENQLFGFTIKIMENPIMQDGVGWLMLSPNDYNEYIKKHKDKKQLEEDNNGK